MASIPETLFNLVKTYSPSGSEGAAVEYLVNRMAALGFTRAFADEAGNAVGVMGEGRKQVILLGHIDTVPGEIPVRVEDNEAAHGSPLLYGRGSVDAKGPLACFVDAAARVGAVDGWQFVVIGAVEEERESDGARSIVPRYHPDFAIIGEPNRWDRVALGYKGTAWAEITARQAQAHTAAASENACEVAVNAWLAAKDWVAGFNAGRKRVFDQLTLTLRGMTSGSEEYVEWARYRLGARLPLDLDPQAWYGKLEEILKAFDSIGVSMEPTGFAIPAWQCEKNTPLVRAFLGAIRATGGTPSFVYKTGTADLNIVAPAWNCPALVYGPGDSALDHTADEHLSLEEYGKAEEVVRAAIRLLCGGQ